MSFSNEPETPRVISGLRRLIYITLGLFFVGLGVVGVFLPLVPTTPFLLLASFFFVRSSPRLNAWLLRSRLFGPFLKDWQRYRGVRLNVKIAALTLLTVAVAASALLADLSWPWLVVLGVLGLTGMIVVLRLPLIRDVPGPPEGGTPTAPSGEASPLPSEPLESQQA